MALLRFNIKPWSRLFLDLKNPKGWLQLLWVLFEKAILLVSYVFLVIAVFMLVDVRIKGRKNIPRHGHVFFLMRHRSFLDPFVHERYLFLPQLFWMPWIFPINIGVKLFFDNWLGRHITGSLAIWVWGILLPDRHEVKDGKRSHVVQFVIDQLNSRRDCMVPLYPNGEREYRKNKLLPDFNSGVGRFILEANSPQIVFVQSEGLDDKWARGERFNFWSRPRVDIWISGALDGGDSDTGLCKVCVQARETKDGRAVAEYLHDVFWACLCNETPELEDLRAVNPKTAHDAAIMQF